MDSFPSSFITPSLLPKASMRSVRRVTGSYTWSKCVSTASRISRLPLMKCASVIKQQDKEPTASITLVEMELARFVDLPNVMFTRPS